MSDLSSTVPSLHDLWMSMLRHMTCDIVSSVLSLQISIPILHRPCLNVPCLQQLWTVFDGIQVQYAVNKQHKSLDPSGSVEILWMVGRGGLAFFKISFGILSILIALLVLALPRDF